MKTTKRDEVIKCINLTTYEEVDVVIFQEYIDVTVMGGCRNSIKSQKYAKLNGGKMLNFRGDLFESLDKTTLYCPIGYREQKYP